MSDPVVIASYARAPMGGFQGVAKDGTSTAANTSPIPYGAAALVMTRASVAEKLGLKVVEKVVAHAARAH